MRMTLNRPFHWRCSLAGALSALVGLASPALAQAQEFPTQPIRWVVGYPQGGGTDFLARTVGAQMAINLKTPLTVENRPGGSAILAAEYVSHAVPDGYTLFSADNGVLIYNVAMYKKLPYDSERSFSLLGMMGRSPLVIIAANNTGIKDAKTLLERLRAEPGKLAIATPGLGTPHHLATELFQSEFDVKMLHVPYKGGAQAVQDVVAGRVPLMMLDLPSGMTALKEGKATALLALSTERIPQLPQVPTAKELGYSKVEAYTWQGLVVPAATPAPVQARLGAELLKAMADGGVRQRLIAAGWQVYIEDAAGWVAYTERERQKWHAFIKANNIKLD